jgi:hypothetical protein
MSGATASAVRNAIERAESRASVLTNLANSFGGADKKANTSINTSTTTRSSKDDANQRVIQCLQTFIGDSRDRTYRTLSDAVVGKSIVLSNVKALSATMKSANRMKRWHIELIRVVASSICWPACHPSSSFYSPFCPPARLTTSHSYTPHPSLLSKLKAEHARRASRCKLRRVPGALCNPTAAPSEKDLQTLHRLWRTYVTRVMADCKNDAQLQARYVHVLFCGLCFSLLWPAADG